METLVHGHRLTEDFVGQSFLPSLEGWVSPVFLSKDEQV